VAVSGTVSQTVFNTRKVIDHAFRKCRLPPEGVGGEQIVTAQETLYLILSSLANRGIQLWCIEKLILPMYPNVAAVPVGNGIVDLLNTNLRTLQLQTGTETSTSTDFTFLFTEATQISNVGVLWNGTPPTSYSFQVSTNGSVWTTVETITNTTSTADQWTWTDIDGAEPFLYFRVHSNGGNLNAADVLVGNTPNEIPMARLNRDNYSNLPNKFFSGRPLQFWLDRTLNEPVMYLWPVPNVQFAEAQIVTYVKRYIMDVGSLTEEIEVPQRWFEAIVYQLAARIAEELPSVDPSMLPILDQKALRSLNEAEMEERDNSPIYFTPNIAVYTR
jgi:hypothetical protein